METVKAYAEKEELFLKQFAESMVKMGNISHITGTMGEITANCRTVLSSSALEFYLTFPFEAAIKMYY